MGNYRFKLSNMMPNAWFYKLNNNKKHHYHFSSKISSAPNHQTITQPPILSSPRDSYHFTRELPLKPDYNLNNSPTNPKISDLHFPPLDPPRKSSKSSRSSNRRRSIKSSSPKTVTSSVSAGCSCRSTLESVWTKSSVSPLQISPDHYHHIDIQESNFDYSNQKFENFDGFDSISEIDLPPILVKPIKLSKKERKETEPITQISKVSSSKFEDQKNVDQERVKKVSPLSRRSFYSLSSPGLKLRSNTPRILTRKTHTKVMESRLAQSFLVPKTKQSCMKSTTSTTKTVKKNSSIERRKKNHSDSYAIIKSSLNPRRDFRDSMVEMIMENNIRASSDLEELLACYLCLNSNEYHDVIVKVFEEIWFDLTDDNMLDCK